MLELLLNSKTRVKVLTLFFGDERRDYYEREVIDATGSDAANVHRELAKLVMLGVLAVTRKGVKKFYRLDPRSPFHKGLKELISATGKTGSSAPIEFKRLNDGDPWMLAEDVRDIDPFFSQIWLSMFPNELRANVGHPYSKVLAVFEGYHLTYYFGERDSNEVAESILQHMLKDLTFGETINRNIVRTSDNLRAFAESIPDDLEKLTNRQLWNLINRHNVVHTKCYEWGWISNAVDMFHNNLTNCLMTELKRHATNEERANEYFTILTQPTERSLIQKEREEFLRLALEIQKDPYHDKLFRELYRIFEEQDASRLTLAPHTPQYEQLLETKARGIRTKIRPKIFRRIERYYEQYYFIKYMWIGKDGVYPFEYYLKELVKLVGRNSDITGMLRNEEQQLREAVETRKGLMARLKLELKWRSLFEAFGGFMLTKVNRRYAQIYTIYRMQQVVEEIAKRLKIDLMQARFMLFPEIRDALLHGRIDKKELEERTRFCVLYTEPGVEVMRTGDEARKLANLVEPKVVNAVDVLKGQIGCMGKARGIVRIIYRPSDMTKMKQGDVLVSIATDPDIVPAMKKAAAIVTEQGGVTSHAAIVSRELNIPCVIGTKIATKVLHDGDLVEVDANRGWVRKLR